MNVRHLPITTRYQLSPIKLIRNTLDRLCTQRTVSGLRFALAFILALLFTYPTVANVSAAGATDVFLPFISAAATGTVTPPPVLSDNCETANDNEIAIANLAINAPGQQRSFMICNPILAGVARDRARDMATRNYFGHTNPDGIGPNTLARNAGYRLPSFYATAQDGNNIESIAAGYPTAQAAFDGWMESSGHRRQVLGEEAFYRDQVEFGIGYFYNENSDFKHYWVFISAYEE